MKRQMISMMMTMLLMAFTVSGVHAARGNDNLIQMAILLDTSGSMEGLIEQGGGKIPAVERSSMNWPWPKRGGKVRTWKLRFLNTEKAVSLPVKDIFG